MYQFLFIAASKKQNTNIISCRKYLIQLLKQELPWDSACALLFTRFLSSVYNSLADRLSPCAWDGPVQALGWVTGALPGRLTISTSAHKALRLQED